MRKHLLHSFMLLCMLLLCTCKLYAGSYTVEFKSTNTTSDSNTSITETKDILMSGWSFLAIANEADAKYIYNAQQGNGIKAGSTSNKGSLLLTATEFGKVYPIKIIVQASNYSTDKTSVNVYVNNTKKTSKALTLTNDFQKYEIEMDGSTELNSIKIEAVSNTNNRYYLRSITVEFNVPHYNDATMQWNKSEFMAKINESCVFPSLILSPGDLANIVYESSNKDVATISSDGEITIVGEGKTVISAFYPGDKEKQFNPIEDVSYTLYAIKDDYVFDCITWQDLTATTNKYTVFSGKKFASSAEYAGNTAKNVGIAMNSDKMSGIITIASGGVIKKVRVSWNSLSDNNGLDFHGNNTAYSDVLQLYSDAKIGSITPETAEFNIDESYSFIGVKPSGSYAYFNSITFVWYVEPATISISSVGYSTYYNSAYAYTMPEGVEGYVFYCDDNKDWKLEKAYGSGVIVPAGEPLVLKGTSSDYTLHFTNSSSASQKSQDRNALCGTDLDADLVADDNSYFYALTLDEKGSASSVGFYWMNETGSAFTNGAHKVYLKIPKNSADSNVRGFAFEDIINSIESPSVERTKSGRIYDMSGREVKNPSKGLYIENGIKRYYK